MTDKNFKTTQVIYIYICNSSIYVILVICKVWLIFYNGSEIILNWLAMIQQGVTLIFRTAKVLLHLFSSKINETMKKKNRHSC